MIDVFIAYSHNDLAYKNELKKFLRPLLREGRISVWDDYDIEAGQDWDAKIKERLYGAHIVLLLVSADSLASDYFYGKEVQVSLERHDSGEAIVVPIILRPCDWAETPLGRLEALPEKAVAVVDWPNPDNAYQNIVTRLRRVVENREQKKKNDSANAEALRLFKAAVNSGDQLFAHQNQTEARAAYQDALKHYKPDFQPDKTVLLSKIAECEKQIKANRRPLASPNPNDEIPKDKRIMILVISVAMVIASIVFLRYMNGVGEKQRDKKGDDPTQTLPQKEEPEANELLDFNTAKAAGTLSALREFVKRQYPEEEYEQAAKAEIKTLENRLKKHLDDAELFHDDPQTACEQVQQAAKIARENERVKVLAKRFKCK